MMSPFSRKLEPIIRNLKQGHLAHLMSVKERQSLIRREGTAEKVSHKVLLGVDAGYHRVELVKDDQVQILPQEGGHGGIRGLLVGACQADCHIVNK